MKKIMLVDDVHISNFILKKLISNISDNYVVKDFTEPEQAFNNIASFDPAIIFLDLNMPVLDGFGFLEKMKEYQLQHDVYILTSSTSVMDKEKASQFTNVKAFLIKPLTPAILANIL